jgi:hypothetical protein
MVRRGVHRRPLTLAGGRVNFQFGDALVGSRRNDAWMKKMIGFEDCRNDAGPDRK